MSALAQPPVGISFSFVDVPVVLPTVCLRVRENQLSWLNQARVYFLHIIRTSQESNSGLVQALLSHHLESDSSMLMVTFQAEGSRKKQRGFFLLGFIFFFFFFNLEEVVFLGNFFLCLLVKNCVTV